jgi:hypothetical protein
LWWAVVSGSENRNTRYNKLQLFNQPAARFTARRRDRDCSAHVTASTGGRGNCTARGIYIVTTAAATTIVVVIDSAATEQALIDVVDLGDDDVLSTQHRQETK